VDELLMALMGFSIDPGPLPFCTVRDAKWGARLESIGWVGIHGEHGCEMPYQVAKVMSIGAITYANAKGFIYFTPEGFKGIVDSAVPSTS
jgi:hypothetical protein